jgi:hypothetical protein
MESETFFVDDISGCDLSNRFSGLTTSLLFRDSICKLSFFIETNLNLELPIQVPWTEPGLATYQIGFLLSQLPKYHIILHNAASVLKEALVENEFCIISNPGITEYRDLAFCLKFQFWS